MGLTCTVSLLHGIIDEPQDLAELVELFMAGLCDINDTSKRMSERSTYVVGKLA